MRREMSGMNVAANVFQKESSALLMMVLATVPRGMWVRAPNPIRVVVLRKNRASSLEAHATEMPTAATTTVRVAPVPEHATRMARRVPMTSTAAVDTVTAAPGSVKRSP